MTNLIDLVLAAKARFVAIQAELDGTFSPQEHKSDGDVSHVEMAWRLARRAEVEIGEGMEQVKQNLAEFSALANDPIHHTHAVWSKSNAERSHQAPLSANQSEGAFFQVIVSADEDADIDGEDLEIPGTYDFKLKYDCPDMTVGQIANVVLESFHESTSIRNDTLDIMVVDRDGNEIEAQSTDETSSADLQRLVCYLGKSSGFDDKPSGMRPSN